MRNAKEEILREDLSKIIAAEIEYKGWFITYKKGGDLNEFLNKLDFEYDAGYGGQELFGIVWFSDGAWLARGEYDGAEWWQHMECPEIPKKLR